MRTKVLIAILLLLMATSTIYASEDPTEQTEYLQKKQQLDQLAERFKAETGFKGTIEYNYKTMQLGSFRGTFSRVYISNDQDTLLIRQAFNTLLDEILPYTYATNNQLVTTGISDNSMYARTDFIQVINGYRIENGGLIGISYNKGNGRFHVGNSTVDIPLEPLGSIISVEEAIQITKNYYVENLGYPEDISIHPATKSIAYVEFKGKYELCYLLGIADPNPGKYIDYTIVICATSGKVIALWNLMSPLNCLVVGEIFNEATNDYINTTTAPMDSVEVQNSNNYYYSDANGNCVVADLSPNIISSRLKLRDQYFLTIHPSETNIEIADSLITNIDGSLTIKYNADDANSANVYYHTTKQYIGLNAFSHFTTSNLRITTGADATYPDFGGYSPSANRILIREDKSKYSHAIRHELSHAFTYGKLSNHWFRDGNWDEFAAAMDESFAHYFPCSVCDSPNAVMGLLPGQAQFENISYITTTMVRDLCWSFFPLNEDVYSYHYMEYPIASAWWTLRDNPLFGLPDPITQVKALDKILIEGLGQVRSELSNNSSYRYKPRYFYNLLMNEVADISQTTGLNDKQRAIDAAYSSRGLHFNPKVESVSSSLKARNIFRLNEPVHVKVSNCPQNTRINVYVIKHNDYTYLDGALTSSLSNHYAHGFTPNTTAITNSSGEWSGLIWTTPSSAEDAVGDYDIIVDIGSPTTPDGIIHFTFSAANVMDGIDGRTQPGFIVSDNGIDVVMAEQASAEAQIANAHQ